MLGPQILLQNPVKKPHPKFENQNSKEKTKVHEGMAGLILGSAQEKT